MKEKQVIKRITFVTFMLFLSASIFAQITINVKNQTIKQIIPQIEKKSGYSIFYSNETKEIVNKKDFSVTNRNIEETLTLLLEGTNIGFQVKADKQILLAQQTPEVKKSTSVANAPIHVKGQILDVKNEPLVGATVTIKDTSRGTITDIDGYFSIDVPVNTVLVISCIGHEKQEVLVKDNKAINIVLKENSKELDEVVIVGYGTQKRVNVTGSVSTITSKSIENRPITNISQALQGMIPGLNMSVSWYSGGTLDAPLNANIRGLGTIGQGSEAEPLILIDGIEGDMNTINPNDVESISVLKDAAASSIYGARGAFGIILITTKSGKEGKPKVNYSSNVRFSKATHLPQMMDSYTYAKYYNQASANDGQGAIFDEETLSKIQAYQKGEYKDGTSLHAGSNKWYRYNGANANTDWFKEMYREWGPSQEHNLSISGGTERVNYMVSGNYLGQKGLVKHGGEHMNRYAINANFFAKINSYMSLKYASRWIRSDYEKPSYMTPLFYHNVARNWVTNPVFDPNGFYLEGNDIQQMRDGGKNTTQRDHSYNQVQLIIEPIKDWRIIGEGNIRTEHRFYDHAILPISAHDGDGNPYLVSFDGRPAGTSTVTAIANKETFLTSNLYTEYSRNLWEHNFKILVGMNTELMKTRSLSGQKYNLLNPEIPSLNTAQSTPSTNGNAGEWAAAGFFGRFNYDYKGRYLVEANLRYDGSSRFLRDKRWELFPSFSAGWNVAKEDFWEEYQDYVSMLKVRASWGQLGNMNTSSWYPFYQAMPMNTAAGTWIVDDGDRPNISNQPGIVTHAMTWETIETLNLGLDWASLNNRLTGSFDYFKRKTKNMIGPAPALPNILGTSVPLVNNSDLESYGFELELAWRDKIGQVSYGARFVLSDDQAKVTKYPQTGDIGGWFVGRKDGTIWGYETVGIAKSDEEMQAHLNTLPNGGQEAMGSNWGAGDIMYKDLNGDGKIDSGSSTLTDHGDMKIIGNSTPRFKYGVTLDAEWKGIDISMFFQGVGKRDLFLDGAYFWGAWDGLWGSVGFKEHWNYFRPEGDPNGANLDAYYPRPYFSTTKNQHTQSGYLQKGSYIRLKNLQVGYTLPQNLSYKIGLQKLRVYVSGENLWTKSSISGMFDPEITGGERGVGKTHPIHKVVSFGLNVNF